MANNLEKKALRKVLLERRDNTSFDLIKIVSKQIHSKIKKIPEFQKAHTVACYYPIGSEILTQDIMLDSMSYGKEVLLPKIVEGNLSFRKITDLNNLQKGMFDIMEPKDDCPVFHNIDVVIVPTVGISKDGYRLGYGHGYYDKFLSKTKTTSIAITFSKQVVKSIPLSEHDVRMDWVVTEDECYNILHKV